MLPDSFPVKSHWLNKFKIYSQTSNIKWQLIYLIIFLFPIYVNLTFIFIDLWVMLWVAEGNFKRSLSVWFKNKYVIFSACFFLLHIIGFLHSSNKPLANFEIHLKYTVFIFPFLLAAEGPLDFSKQKIIIKSFIAGCIINGMVCIIHALWRYFTSGLFKFQYILFAWYSHPSYLCMYMDTALVLAFYLLINKSSELSKGEKKFLFFSILFLEFIIILLQSKTGLIITFATLCIFFVRYARVRGNRKKAIYLVSATIIIFSACYTFILDPSQSRMTNAIHVLLGGKMTPQSTESTQVRYYVWKAAFQAAQKSNFIGVGAGSTEDALLQQYSEDGLSGAVGEKLNAHNEYLEYAVTLGIPGLLGLLAYLLVPLLTGLKQHRTVLVFFISIIAINFITESVLERLEGTLFYGLFNSLLMFNLLI
jgi:O-antigen ligase